MEVVHLLRRSPPTPVSPMKATVVRWFSRLPRSLSSSVVSAGQSLNRFCRACLEDVVCSHLFPCRRNTSQSVQCPFGISAACACGDHKTVVASPQSEDVDLLPILSSQQVVAVNGAACWLPKQPLFLVLVCSIQVTCMECKQFQRERTGAETVGKERK